MSGATVDPSVYLDRLARVRQAMTEHDIDTLLLSVGHDLPYLTGYTAMPLERLTMLVADFPRFLCQAPELLRLSPSRFRRDALPFGALAVVLGVLTNVLSFVAHRLRLLALLLCRDVIGCRHS